MDNTVPIPKPRSNNVIKNQPVLNISQNIAKKPVPLPRSKKVSQQLNASSDVNNDTNSSGEENKFSDVENPLNENLRMQRNRLRSKNMREEWKMTCEEATLKGKCLIENTKHVSSRLEKSVRNILTRRSTVRSFGNSSTDSKSAKSVRSCSLPTEDIFQTISFPSPLSVEKEGMESPIVYEEPLMRGESGAPPPVYPPPPLPDESVYDEVQSSHSSSCDVYSESFITDLEQGIDTIYEDITSLRNSKLSGSSQYSGSEFEHPILNEVSSKSDSWRFFQLNNEEVYQNASVAGSSDSDDLSFVNVSSIDGSVCSREKVQSQCSNAASVNISNDLYENWDISSPNASPRQFDLGLKVLTKSVILEFDPLFEAPEESDAAGQDSFTEFMLQSYDPKSPYGKINKLLISPPVPPRRFDSITPASDVVSKSSGDKLVPGLQDLALSVDARDGNVNSMEEAKDLPVDTGNVAGLPNMDTTVETDKLVCGEEPAQNTNSTSDVSSVNGVVDISSTNAQEQLQISSVPGNTGAEKNRKTAIVRWASMKRALQSMTDRRTPREQINSVFYGEKNNSSKLVKRPNWIVTAPVNYSGILYRCDRLRNFVQRQCILAEGKLSCCTDKTGTNVGDVIPLEKVASVQLVMEHKVGIDGEDLHLFEVNLSWKGCYYLFGVPGSSERRVWMQKILESLTSVFPVRTLADYTRAGWSFIKEGISGVWTSGWLLVHKRMLVYCAQEGSLKELDLRKARCTVLQDSKHETASLCVLEKGPLILVDFPGQALYLQMDTIKETVGWHGVIHSAAVDNGLHLDQQQLTREDIPAIVDKCINFVYAHGSMSEGIYRRSGANSSVTKLLTQFRQDAWAVQLTRQDYSEYDVASVLKRFLRDLPEPLLTTELHSPLCEIAAGKCGSDRVTHYKKVLERLPPINYITTRRLIGHLHFIHEQHEKNLMPVENLAAIWGPTLMHIEGGDNLNWSKLESAVVSDLILLYSQIFDVDDAELLREKQMLAVLERYHVANTAVPQTKSSGDLKIWIYLVNRNSSNCVNVTVGPQKLASEVCSELAGKIGLPAHELCLEEVVCGGALTRPLHHTERVLDVVLRWGYWDDIDRKDNCLVLCQNTVFKEAAVQAKFPMALCGELRFADCKSRSFKTYLFEFSQAKLCYYKDKRGSVKLKEWKIEDILWYLGYEPKRNPQMRWAVTFIDRHKKPLRSKENPYFGYTIAGTSKEEQLRWIGAMLAAEHPLNVLPSPELLH